MRLHVIDLVRFNNSSVNEPYDDNLWAGLPPGWEDMSTEEQESWTVATATSLVPGQRVWEYI